MRKQLTLFAFVAIFFVAATAQDEFVSKKGIPILPEAGEYSLGISATPFLQYMGNVFNGSLGNTAPGFGFTAANPMQITGKYMVDANTAYRGIFRIGYTSETKNFNSVKDAIIADPLVTVEDSWNKSKMSVALGAGLEKRRGKGRIQGIYGATAMFFFDTGSDTYTYGNDISSTFTTPTRHDFGTNNNGNAWTTKNSYGTTFGLQVAAFVGAEYFFAPKFSISGEFNYGFALLSQTEGTSTEEYWGTPVGSTAAPTVVSQDTKIAGNNSWGFDTGVSARLNLNLNFYF